MHLVYGGTRLGFSDKAADICRDDGTRIEVKAAVQYPGRRLGLLPFRTIQKDDADTEPFAFVVVVVFEPDTYRVKTALQIPLDVVVAKSRYIPHIHGYGHVGRVATAATRTRWKDTLEGRPAERQSGGSAT